MGVPEQIKHIYSSVHASLQPLCKAALPWFILAVVTQVATGQQEIGGANSDLSTLGMGGSVALIVHLLAIFLGWHALHRYMIDPTQQPGVVAKSSLRFVVGQIVNFALLLMLSMVVVFPLALFFVNDVYYMSPDAQAALKLKISMVALPIFLMFFSRLLLVAPMSARNEVQPLRRSWAATRGHFIRINLLQLACLLPLAVTETLGSVLKLLGSSYPALFIISLVAVTGAFLSLMLFTRLAEDEYKKLFTS